MLPFISVRSPVPVYISAKVNPMGHGEINVPCWSSSVCFRKCAFMPWRVLKPFQFSPPPPRVFLLLLPRFPVVVFFPSLSLDFSLLLSVLPALFTLIVLLCTRAC